MTEINSGSPRTPPPPIYIYELPFFDRRELCRMLDENNTWEQLGGGLMGYSSAELAEFGRAVYRGASPTEALLSSWGNQNHTLLELFTLCATLHHGRAMRLLAKYVESKYHAFIPTPSPHATELLLAAAVDPNLNKPELVVNGGVPPDPNVQKEEAKKELIQKGLASLSDTVGHIPQVAYGELTSATNGWDRRTLLGKGGFGTVYKGMWKNTAVAIKRMEQHRPSEAFVESQMKQSLGEMKFLNSYRHDNILPLYAFSLEGPHPCLVYQFMPNGSLEDRILCRQKTPPLGWLLRFHIAKGVACGIQFLHSIGPQPLIHGDIKSANILLDRNFEPKVGDFGLARELTSASNASYVKVSRVHGTRPYLPDEYLRSKRLSTKVDSYSFGIVMFELATGLRAYEESRPKKMLKDMIEDTGGGEALKDSKGGPEYNPEVFLLLIHIGRCCIERVPKKRPEMVEVLKTLEASLPHNSTGTSYQQRTVSTHGVPTGFPYLFDLPASRPGSLGLPPPMSSLTPNRTSPDGGMRAGSPWGQPMPGLPSPGGVRKSQSSHPIEPLVFHTPAVPIRPQQVSSHSNSNNVLMATATSASPSPSPLAPLTIDTSQYRPPEVNLIQPSPSHSPVPPPPLPLPQPLIPMIEQQQQGQGQPGPFSLIPEDDEYLPLVLDQTTNTTTTEDSPATVIPLITELGIKDDPKT